MAYSSGETVSYGGDKVVTGAGTKLVMLHTQLRTENQKQDHAINISKPITL